MTGSALDTAFGAFGPLVAPLALVTLPLVAECAECGGRSPLPVGECEAECQWCGADAWSAGCALCQTAHPCEC